MSRWASKLAAVTRLSCRPGETDRVFSLLPRLARLSLLGLFVCTLPSCLVDDPPPYTAPKQSPPRLDDVGATPFLNQIIVASYLEKLTFHIPFVSEDAGQDLTAMLLLDYNGSPQIPKVTVPVKPGSLDVEGRTIDLTYNVETTVAPGCHRFTLRVSHTPNFIVGNPPSVFDTQDVAEAYWWANIAVDTASAGTLKDCKDAVSP
jgi:hypothetical protein